MKRAFEAALGEAEKKTMSEKAASPSKDVEVKSIVKQENDQPARGSEEVAIQADAGNSKEQQPHYDVFQVNERDVDQVPTTAQPDTMNTDMEFNIGLDASQVETG